MSNTTYRTDETCWVVLGGPAGKQGAFSCARPPYTALGRFPSLLPIVVVCSTETDGRMVEQLNDKLFRNIATNDYRRLKEAIEGSEEVAGLLTGHNKFYAIRIGVETGIYVGFHWDDIEHIPTLKGSKYKSHPTLREALLYMIEKHPHNKDPSSSASQRISVSRAVRSTTPGITVNIPNEATEGELPKHIPNTEFAEDEKRSASEVPLGIQALRQVVRPLFCQNPAGAGRWPLTFGQCADAYLLGRGASTEDRVKILQALVHADSALGFARCLTMELGWKIQEGKDLWDLIELPLLK